MPKMRPTRWPFERDRQTGWIPCVFILLLLACITAGCTGTTTPTLASHTYVDHDEPEVAVAQPSATPQQSHRLSPIPTSTPNSPTPLGYAAFAPVEGDLDRVLDAESS
jgi:hypothetical protein